MYKNLLQMINNEAEISKETITNLIISNEDILRRESTATRWTQYKAGTITREQANAYAIKRAYKRIDAQTAEKVETLQDATNAPDIEYIQIYVTWRKSRTWGYNPTADITITTANNVYNYTGTASGCGYDKESAAIAQALNKSTSIKKMLCNRKEQAIPTGAQTSHSAIAYGAGYNIIPYFEGGVGIGSHKEIFKVCGLSLVSETHSKHTDTYLFKA